MPEKINKMHEIVHQKQELLKSSLYKIIDKIPKYKEKED